MKKKRKIIIQIKETRYKKARSINESQNKNIKGQKQESKSCYNLTKSPTNNFRRNSCKESSLNVNF